MGTERNSCLLFKLQNKMKLFDSSRVKQHTLSLSPAVRNRYDNKYDR